VASIVHVDLLINTINRAIDIERVDPVFIIYQWFGGGACPNTECRLCYIRNAGFAVKMKCWEENPLARFTHDDDPVYKDSYMEFFVDFFPESKRGY
jgi:hypothetical protein